MTRFPFNLPLNLLLYASNLCISNDHLLTHKTPTYQQHTLNLSSTYHQIYSKPTLNQPPMYTTIYLLNDNHSCPNLPQNIPLYFPQSTPSPFHLPTNLSPTYPQCTAPLPSTHHYAPPPPAIWTPTTFSANLSSMYPHLLVAYNHRYIRIIG